MEKTKIRVEAIVNPTEDEGKVSEAIRRIFPSIILSFEQHFNYGRLTGTYEGREGLATMRMLIRARRIRAAARAFLKRHKTNNILSFLLNKHAASAGRVSFCEDESETPLGGIRIVIESGDVDELIEWLTE